MKKRKSQASISFLPVRRAGHRLSPVPAPARQKEAHDAESLEGEEELGPGHEAPDPQPCWAEGRRALSLHTSYPSPGWAP